jgi:hypothetical protein
MDSNGYPHISYYDDLLENLKYAYQGATGWYSQTVDSAGEVGAFSSIQIDSSDYPHISYYDNENSDLKYAYQDSGGWHIETVDSIGYVGKDTSLALDANDLPHISYSDGAFFDLKYASLSNPGAPVLLLLSGPSLGEINAPYSFMASVGPISTTLPLTYTWSATGQAPVIHTGGLNDVIIFSWPTTGAQAITVTVSNDLGTVSGSYLINILETVFSTYLPVARRE